MTTAGWTKSLAAAVVCCVVFIHEAKAASCRNFAREARAAIKTHVSTLQRLEREASDRTKGLDTRPYDVLRDEVKKAVAIIADPAALKDEEALARCRDATMPIRKICAGAGQGLLDILEKHVATATPEYDRPAYAAAIADCEKLMGLKPVKTVIRGMD